MMDPNRLRERWNALWRRCGASDAADGNFNLLLEAYSEPHRAYHNLAHVAHCLRELDHERGAALQADAIEAAVWLHDLVYDPRRSDNETRSADRANQIMRELQVADAFIGTVGGMILATRHDRIPDDQDTRLLLDIDLSILGQPPDVYDRYEHAIRQEYAHVDEASYRAGRRSVLQRFLARPDIYLTPPLRLRYERLARRNLRRSLEQLR